MSQTSLHSTTSAELAGRRRWPPIVPVLFTLSFLLVIYMVVADIVFGIRNIYLWNPVTADGAYTLAIMAWFLSVPLAAILAGVGAAIAARIPRRRLWLMIGFLVVVLVAPFIVGSVAPLAGSWLPWVFGGGGALIITSVLLTCWFWAEMHAQPRPAQRRGTDLRLIAYVLLGMAAWWTCGVASSVVVFSGRLQDWAMVQTPIYSIMADLVLGWGLLLASQVLASRAVGSSEVEHAGSLGSSEEGVVSVPLQASK